MPRTVQVTVTGTLIGRIGAAENEPHAVVRAAIEQALPGVAVMNLDPVDVGTKIVDPTVVGELYWTFPTPDPVARHLYHEAGVTEPYEFILTVPDCLAGYLLGPEAH